jgi:hypothetical protein
MKSFFRRMTWLAVFCAATLPSSAADDEGFEAIFDGKTLEGWDGKADFWSVKDGAITGQTTAEKPTRGNTFCIYKGGKPGDFELRLKFKIVGGNSGIQYRSEDKGNHVVHGYQADIDAGLGYMGILYEEGGRGVLANRGAWLEINSAGEKKDVGKTGDEKVIVDSIKKEDWNDYVVIAKGNHLIHKINGHVTVDVTDSQTGKAKSEGILALQLHAGPPMTVQFKDIRLKKVK